MILFPNAKINLGLSVVRRRADGYHELQTVFYPVPLHDVLECALCQDGQKGMQFSVWSEYDCGDPQKNLVQKAYALLSEDFALPAVTACLVKKIPVGAGLGGGSADAAFMLRCLRDLLQLPLTDAELLPYAARLGADCAFFILNTPCLATGIGEVLTSLPLSLAGYTLCLVKPSFGISTSEAYGTVQPQPPAMSVEEAVNMPIAQWREVLHNDFEPALFPRYPLLGDIKQQLYASGAVYAAMSGSGSTMFGLYAPGAAAAPGPLPQGCQLFTCRL